MGKIVLLDDVTINQIAAGEVIERPANVVKELVENSIDAGATNIVVEIKKGGKELIKVIDNGKGIEREDMIISMERHATSKIRQVEDLENTYTMGFRGEALASIVSISKFTMISKTADDPVGIKVYAEAGEIISTEEIASQTGTTIMVENLFFCTPVRYKFLKQDFTEFRYIKDMIQNIALAHPDLTIKLINDGKNVFQTSGNGKIRDIIYTLYGKEITDNTIDVNYKEGPITITGVIGNTLIAKDNRKNQQFFLNKRPIKDALLTKTADQAFKGGTGIGKYGFFILNMDMPANMYDVNVHPTKTEVRFKNEDEINRALYSSIKSSSLNESFLGNTEESKEKKNYVLNEYNFATNHTDKKEPSVEVTPEGNLIKRDNKRKIDYKFIGISFKTYIMIEIDDDIYLIDQHAGHERLLYEQIKDNYKKNVQGNSQMLLIPEVLNLQHKELDFIKNNMELFEKIGYSIDFFGDNTIKINGIPDIEYREKTNTREMFLDILDEMTSNANSHIKNVEDRFIATVACKAAVKAGMDLKKEEVDTLIQNLLNLQNPYTCPHGRPTTIKLNRNEILKNNI